MQFGAVGVRKNLARAGRLHIPRKETPQRQRGALEIIFSCILGVKDSAYLIHFAFKRSYAEILTSRQYG